MSALLAIGTALLWLLVGLLVLVAGLVVFPLGVRASGAVDEERIHGRAYIHWLLGLVGVAVCSEQGVTLRLLGLRVWRFSLDQDEAKAAKKKQRKKAKKAKKKQEKKTHSPLAQLRAVLSYRGFLWRFGGRLLGTLALRGRAGGLIGTGDPIEMVGLRAAILTVDQRVDALELDFEFDYVDEILDVWADLRGRLWLAHILWVLLLYVCKRDTWRLWKLLRA